ncbi:hypothetical protein N9X39_00735 [Alphaproteobacteria bacterium]|nr:hypothetical protein [Alphaproteobacteria bacterium]
MKIFLKNGVRALLGVGALVVFSANCNADEASVASDIVNGLNKPFVVAVQPINRSEAKVSATTAKSIADKLINSIQLKGQSVGITQVDRGKLEDINREQQEFQNIDDYSKLIANAGADVIISPSVNRLSDQEIEISARALGVKGSAAGKILAASKTYRIKAPLAYVVFVSSVMQGDRDRASFGKYVNSGISSFKEFAVKNEAGDSSELDFEVSVGFNLSSIEKETAESKEAKKGAQGLGMFSSIVSGMGSGSGGANPLAGIGGMQNQMAEDADAAKVIEIKVTAEASMKNTQSGSVITEVVEVSDTVPKSSSKDEQKALAKRLVSDALSNAGKMVAAKVLGKSAGASSGGGLLD